MKNQIVKVAKFRSSSIGRTKNWNRRYSISNKLTKTENRPFFKLLPRHFFGRIFWKKHYHVTYQPQNYPQTYTGAKIFFLGVRVIMPLLQAFVLKILLWNWNHTYEWIQIQKFATSENPLSKNCKIYATKQTKVRDHFRPIQAILNSL